MNALPHMFEDRPRVRLRLGDISVDARIAPSQDAAAEHQPDMPTTMTNRLRLRPVLLLLTTPTPAPISASGMTISQLSQPSKRNEGHHGAKQRD